MSNQICLKWNSFLNNIASSFESLWEEEGLVDVTLASDGQCLTAHKVILSASSPFFKKVFQTNPCKHPVIVFQDVHFSELEALLIFIYKGQVNIEQKNLPALLKAAETLQIRGLSGNDALTDNSYTEFGDFEKKLVDKISKSPNDEPPKRKKQKISKERDSILESVLSSRGCTSSITSETSNSDKSVKDAEIGETMANPFYDPLELKVEPFEVTMEELQKDTSPDPEPSKLDPDTSNEAQGTSSKSPVKVIAEAAENLVRIIERDNAELTEHTRIISGNHVELTLDNVDNKNDCDQHVNDDCTTLSAALSNDCGDNSQMIQDNTIYPPFPCPFCDKAYASWGFRRRHIKAVHTISPKLTCKWCAKKLSSHEKWKRHVISSHSLSEVDAHNGLLILEEAHMVLQNAHPTRLDTLVNIIKQNSQQSTQKGDGQSD